MAERTAIEWADATFNPWLGCQKVASPCDHCYAEGWAKRSGQVGWGPHAERRRTSGAYWRQPLRWNAEAERAGTRPFVFGGSLCDVFDNRADPAWRRDYFALIRETPRLTWLLLTKRIGNAVDMSIMAGELPDNAALGATFATQDEVDRDMPRLMRAAEVLKPAFTFGSFEPLLGPVDVLRWLPGAWECAEGCGWRSARWPRSERCHGCDCIVLSEGEACAVCGAVCGAEDDFTPLCDECDGRAVHDHPDTPCLDWIIAGGESGAAQSRPAHPDWFRTLRDQAAAANVPFLFKQWGDWREFGHLEDGPAVHEVEVGTEEADAYAAAVPPRSRAWLTRDGRVFRSTEAIPENTPARFMERIGKARSGRTLDGRVHDARPVVAA